MRKVKEMAPIGRVFSVYRNPKEVEAAIEEELHNEMESEIVLRNDLAPALEGLDEFSHIWIIYGMDRTRKTELKTNPVPPEIRDLPKIGVFASRSQFRPNHIILRLVELVGVKGNRLVVRGLDAINNSPVLDIKPYVPYYDLPENPRVADWYSRWMR